MNPFITIIQSTIRCNSWNSSRSSPQRVLPMSAQKQAELGLSMQSQRKLRSCSCSSQTDLIFDENDQDLDDSIDMAVQESPNDSTNTVFSEPITTQASPQAQALTVLQSQGRLE